MSSFEDKLKAFLDNYEQLNSVANEEAYLREFIRLKAQSASYKEKNLYPADSGQLSVNRKKNRFKDIIPFEYTRVSLHAIEGVEGSDYVNANYIQDADGNVTYIAAQGPLPHTIGDFWRMLWYHNIEIVLMACKLVEMAKPKCECYWPLLNETKSYGPITVSTVHEEEIDNEFIIRDFVAECEGEKQMIRQYHYSSWPDHGRPSHPQPVLKMIDMMHEYRRRLEVPVLVHCSAGCGRTGTIIAIDIARSMVLNKHISDSFSPHNIVESMRKQRPAMVQAKEQYVFVFMAMAVLTKKALGYQSQPVDTAEEKIFQTSSNSSIENEEEKEESECPYENCTQKGAPVPLPRKSSPPHSQPRSEEDISTEEKPPPVAPPRTNQGYENIPSSFSKGDRPPPPPTVRPKPRLNNGGGGGGGGANNESAAVKTKPTPPPKHQPPPPPSADKPLPPEEEENQYSMVDITQLIDKGPEIAVVSEEGRRALLGKVEEQLGRYGEDGTVDVSTSRSIIDTIMSEVGDLLPSEEEKRDPSPPPPPVPAARTTTGNQWSEFQDEIPPPIPLHTEASTHILSPADMPSTAGNDSERVVLESGIYYAPTPHSIPMPGGGMSSATHDTSSPPTAKPPPPPTSPRHHTPAPPSTSTLPVTSTPNSSGKGSRLKIFKGLGKSKSEKRKPLTSSDIGKPTGMPRSPSDHALSSPPRGNSPSPDHGLPSTKDYISDLGAAQSDPANNRYTFPGEMGFGMRIPRPKGPRPEPPHWNVIRNSSITVT